MSLKSILSFRWLVELFRRERAKLRAALKPFAVKVAEDLFERDFDQDGAVADARVEVVKLLRSMNTTIGRAIFAEYYSPDGSLRHDIIELLPVKFLKKLLAIAKLVDLLRGQGWPIPLPAIVKHGWGLLDSVLQKEYENGVKPKA